MSKYIVPVIIAFLVMLVLAAYGLGILSIEETGLPAQTFKVVAVLALIGLGIGLITVLWQRIKEIKGGDEDDIGKY